MLCQITFNLALSKRTDSEHYELALTSVSEDVKTNPAYLSAGAEIAASHLGEISTPRGGLLNDFFSYAASSRARTAKARPTRPNATKAAPSSSMTVGAPVPSRLKRNMSTCQVIGLI